MKPADPSASSPSSHRQQISRIILLAGLALIVGPCLMAARGREPFATWLFPFVWWGYIFFVDGWIYRRRNESLLLSHPGRFLFYAGWSVVLWMLFELINVRLNNWSYVGVVENLPLRWFGYVISFATVVPGLMETADLLDAAGVVRSGRVKPLGWKKGVEPYFVVLGMAMLLLPLVWPRSFFPLVWGAFILLLEPLNERLGAASLLSDWRTGHLRRFYILLLSGFLCGILWEAWNALSRARWVYDIPWVGEPKIFEMPVLGYLGFPPFAVEVFVMTSLAVFVWEKSSQAVRAILIGAALAGVWATCRAIDAFTVTFHSTAY
jgi:hypothetical protein